MHTLSLCLSFLLSQPKQTKLTIKETKIKQNGSVAIILLQFGTILCSIGQLWDKRDSLNPRRKIGDESNQCTLCRVWVEPLTLFRLPLAFFFLV